MSDSNEELPVTDVFDNWHAIGLIARLNRDNGNIKAEIQEKVDLTSKPLKELLDDAIDADLIEETQVQASDHARSDRYQLTERGKAVQSLLRLRGLDDLQHAYITAKAELQRATDEVQDIIKAENLHKKYSKQDYWVRTGSGSSEIDAEKLLTEVQEEHEDLFTEDIRGEWDVDILTEEPESREPVETWGEAPDEEDDQEE
jgi:phenylalanyl-tRNA synthetase alpha subunit